MTHIRQQWCPCQGGHSCRREEAAAQGCPGNAVVQSGTEGRHTSSLGAAEYCVHNLDM